MSLHFLNFALTCWTRFPCPLPDIMQGIPFQILKTYFYFKDKNKYKASHDFEQARFFHKQSILYIKGTLV